MPGAVGRFTSISSPLERQGPTGETHQQTSNRAELRAVIGALQYRAWHGEGFKTVVIATDSEYTVLGITGWVRGWLRRNWHTSAGKPVKNKDLWQVLLGRIEELSERGTAVKFWHIPRYLNAKADRKAKDAAASDEPIPEEFVESSGMMV